MNKKNVKHDKKNGGFFISFYYFCADAAEDEHASTFVCYTVSRRQSRRK